MRILSEFIKYLSLSKNAGIDRMVITSVSVVRLASVLCLNRTDSDAHAKH